MGASLKSGAQLKMKSLAPQIGSTKNSMRTVASAFDNKVSAQASNGQFGGVQTSRRSIMASSTTQAKLSSGSTSMVHASLGSMNAQSRMNRNVITQASGNNFGSEFSIGGSKSFPVQSNYQDAKFGASKSYSNGSVLTRAIINRTTRSRGSLLVMNSVTKKPDLSDPVLRAKLAKGMGHNYYGEPAWPNDLLYIFPVVILGTIALCTGLAVMEPTMLGEPADPFATPLEILPEWYFFPTFNALRVIPNKLIGVLSMAAVPVGLLTVPFLESINKFQNPFRRPVATTVFLIGTFYAIWMGIGATMPIDKAITLGVF